MKIKIGTRKSRLALAQTEMAVHELERAFPDIETEIVHITTKGDRITGKSLLQIGGKGVFIAEIERALTEGEIDIAVHSAKDLPLALMENTEIGAVLKRGNPCDVLVTRKGAGITENPLIGTGSQRRRNQFRKICENAVFADIRGNVDTRLNKLANGGYDGIILAAAGLERLGLNQDNRFEYREFSAVNFIPAPCQGIIAVQCRTGELNNLLDRISDKNTCLCLETEREVMRQLDSGCTMPVGAYAETDGESVRLYVTADSGKICSESAGIGQRFELAERLVKEL